MSNSELFTTELTFNHVEGKSKKKALETLSKAIATAIPSFDANELFDNFVAREKLSSTGIGEGVAIPHCRLDSCSKITCVLAKLSEPVDFDSDDGEAVDLLTLIIVPKDETQDHLDTLKQIVTLLSNPKLREQLRSSSSAKIMYDLVQMHLKN